jgi:large subunit ribosomal protein L25
MDINISLSAKPRTQFGKGPSGKLRRQGLIPAVFYSRGAEARPLTVENKELKKALFSREGGMALLRLEIEGEGGTEEKTVTLKEHQLDPVNRTVIHVDFQEVDINRPLMIEVPLLLIGKSEGVERGGVLQQIRRVLTVSALPKDLPEKIEVDVSHMNVGDSIHIDEVTPPEGVEIVHDVNFTLATLAMPRALKTDVEGAEEEGEAPVEAEEGGTPEEAPPAEQS